MLESAIQEFCKRFQLPGIFRVIEWRRAVREFFYPTDRPNRLETNFVHADEAETVVALLMFKGMIDMSVVQDAFGDADSFLIVGYKLYIFNKFMEDTNGKSKIGNRRSG